MKCRLIRELEVAPGAMPPAFVAANAVGRSVMRNGKMRPVLFWKIGTVLALPDSFRLVQQGCALPDDEECEERVGRTPEEHAAAQRQYEKVEKGIHPDDYGLYDDGVIVGYEEDGSYKPGPNFHLLEAAAEEEAAAEVVTAKGPE